MDVSIVGLEHVRHRLDDRLAPRVLRVAADADAWPFRPDSFDVIVQIDFLERRLFSDLRSALKHGGLLLIETFLDQGRPNADGPSRTEFLLAPDELPRVFEDFETLRYEETRGETARATWLGRKRSR
jgi:tellurite methyltransferase